MDNCLTTSEYKRGRREALIRGKIDDIREKYDFEDYLVPDDDELSGWCERDDEWLENVPKNEWIELVKFINNL